MKRLHVLKVFALPMFLLFCGFTSSLSAATASGEQPKKLNIGLIECLTGMSSDNLKLAADGAKLAQSYVNDRGGVTVNGEKYMVNLLIEDNKGSSDGSAAAANKLVYDKKVKFIVGGAQGFVNMAITSITEPAGVLYVAEYHNGSKQELNSNTPLKFFANSDFYSSQGTAMTYLKKIHPEVKTIAFLTIDDGNIREITPTTRETAAKLGLTILGDIIGYNPTTVDTSPIVQKALALKPDAIMIGNGPTYYVAQVLKGARSSGYTKPVFCCSNAPPQDVLTIVGKEAATNYFGHGLSLDVETPNLPDITKEIMAAAKKDLGKIDFEMMHGFNAVYSVVQAIEAAQSLDPKVVAAKWNTMETINTSFGQGKMGGEKTYGAKHNVYFTKPILRLEEGQLSFGDWIPAYMP